MNLKTFAFLDYIIIKIITLTLSFYAFIIFLSNYSIPKATHVIQIGIIGRSKNLSLDRDKLIENIKNNTSIKSSWNFF